MKKEMVKTLVLDTVIILVILIIILLEFICLLLLYSSSSRMLCTFCTAGATATTSRI